MRSKQVKVKRLPPRPQIPKQTQLMLKTTTLLKQQVKKEGLKKQTKKKNRRRRWMTTLRLALVKKMEHPQVTNQECLPKMLGKRKSPKSPAQTMLGKERK